MEATVATPPVPRAGLHDALDPDASPLPHAKVPGAGPLTVVSRDSAPPTPAVAPSSPYLVATTSTLKRKQSEADLDAPPAPKLAGPNKAPTPNRPRKFKFVVLVPCRSYGR